MEVLWQPQKENTMLSPVNRCHRPQHHGRTFMVRRSCSVPGGTKRSCLLWAAETWRFHYGRSVSATIDSFELCIARKTAGNDKVILLHDNAQPHVGLVKVVKKYLETLKWDVLHPPYSPDIAPSDYWLFRKMQHDLASHRFISFAEIENWLQRWIIFSRWNSKIAWEMGKSSRQRWTIF